MKTIQQAQRKLFFVAILLATLFSFHNSGVNAQEYTCSETGTVYDSLILTDEGMWLSTPPEDSLSILDSKRILFGYELLLTTDSIHSIRLTCLRELVDTIVPPDTIYPPDTIVPPITPPDTIVPSDTIVSPITSPDNIPPSDTADCRSIFSYSRYDTISGGSYLYQFIDESISSTHRCEWDFGDGAYSNEHAPIHAYDTGGIHWVCLTIYSANGCEDTFCNDVIIGATEACNADFSYCEYNPASPDNVGMYDTLIPNDGLTIGFKNLTTSDGYYSEWNFGDGSGSTNKNPVHRYAAQGLYEVSLTIYTATGCSSTITKQVQVGITDCDVDFTFVELVPDCGGYNIAYLFEADLDPRVDYLEWSFGDGEMSYEDNPIHTYEEYGTYEVCLYIESGDSCQNQKCKTIVFNQDSINQAFKSSCDATPIRSLEAISELSVESIYPVPAKDYTQFIINSDFDQNISIELINIMGQKYYLKNNYQLSEGKNIVNVDLMSLPMGTYIYKILTKENVVAGTLLLTE